MSYYLLIKIYIHIYNGSIYGKYYFYKLLTLLTNFRYKVLGKKICTVDPLKLFTEEQILECKHEHLTLPYLMSLGIITVLIDLQM